MTQLKYAVIVLITLVLVLIRKATLYFNLVIVKMLTNQPQKVATKAKSWHTLSPTFIE
jgi:hypothetical protein